MLESNTTEVSTAQSIVKLNERIIFLDVPEKFTVL